MIYEKDKCVLRAERLSFLPYYKQYNPLGKSLKRSGPNVLAMYVQGDANARVGEEHLVRDMQVQGEFR